MNFGVLSIYQPRKCGGQGVFPGFLGFYGCFLESDERLLAVQCYMLYVLNNTIQYEVVFIRRVQLRVEKRNQSTRDGTKVV